MLDLFISSFILQETKIGRIEEKQVHSQNNLFRSEFVYCSFIMINKLWKYASGSYKSRSISLVWVCKEVGRKPKCRVYSGKCLPLLQFLFFLVSIFHKHYSLKPYCCLQFLDCIIDVLCHVWKWDKQTSSLLFFFFFLPHPKWWSMCFEQFIPLNINLGLGKAKGKKECVPTFCV